MRLTIVHYAKSKLNKQCIKYVVKVFDTVISLTDKNVNLTNVENRSICTVVMS